jgi:CDP-diacylglycerol--glycerol-3-phosphate 3-phosphatidyltransferase
VGEAAVSNLYLMTRAAYEKLSRPVAKAALRAGLTPDSITILGTAGSVLGALTLFPIGQLFWGWVVVSFFVLADMLDGAMARQRGGGTRFGAVLDATCDRIGDGAIFCGLLWWAAFGMRSASLVVATLICLVTSQVISYIKARAEASGLSAEGGMIERPERLMIVLGGAGLSGLFGVPWLLHVAMWLLAVTSLITLGQRVHSVRTSPGAMDPLTKPDTASADGEKPETSGHSPRERGAHPPGEQGDEP